MTLKNHMWAARTVLVLLAMAMALTLTPTIARADHRPNGYFSPNGDYYTKAFKDDGVRLELGALAFSGRFRLCVTTPDDERTCRRFRLREDDDGVYKRRVRWAEHFPTAGPGAYKVSWHKGGGRLGPVLGFHIR